MSEEETVEVTIRVPKNAIAALREFVLKHDAVSEEEYWKREAVGGVLADIDCICCDLKVDPVPIVKKYGLLKYYHDC